MAAFKIFLKNLLYCLMTLQVISATPYSFSRKFARDVSCPGCSVPVDLVSVSATDATTFFDSFDTVITSIEGVIVDGSKPIPGAIEMLNKLKTAGKEILFVTNNNLFSTESYTKFLSAMGYCDSAPKKFILPSSVIAWHLKSIGFTGKALVFGSKHFKNDLVAKHIDVVTGPSTVSESFVLSPFTTLDSAVKAVIFEFDPNINWAKTLHALEYLKSADVKLFVGAVDDEIEIDDHKKLIGAGSFFEIVSKKSGKSGVSYASPSLIMQQYITANYISHSATRYLFIGPSLEKDMALAKLCGFPKVWLTSEDAKKVCATGCKGSPEYYARKLSDLPIADKTHVLSVDK